MTSREKRRGTPQQLLAGSAWIPLERFWTFQRIESGIFTGAALLLFALAVFRIRRRLS